MINLRIAMILKIKKEYNFKLYFHQEIDNDYKNKKDPKEHEGIFNDKKENA